MCHNCTYILFILTVCLLLFHQNVTGGIIKPIKSMNTVTFNTVLPSVNSSVPYFPHFDRLGIKMLLLLLLIEYIGQLDTSSYFFIFYCRSRVWFPTGLVVIIGNILSKFKIYLTSVKYI